MIREEYWAHWDKRRYVDRVKNVSWSNADKLESKAERVGIEDRLGVKEVFEILRKGAELECK